MTITPHDAARPTHRALVEFWRRHAAALAPVPRALYDELNVLIRADERARLRAGDVAPTPATCPQCGERPRPVPLLAFALVMACVGALAGRALLALARAGWGALWT